MSEQELTDAEANKLFNQISKAIQTDDSEKLSSLMTEQPLEEEEPIKTEEPETPPELEDEKDNESPPDKEKADTPVEKEEEKPEEKTELDKLREDLSRVSKENHALRSQAGRVPHVQRKIKELDKKLEELAKRQSSPSNQTSTKIQPRVQELLKGVKDADPELADAIAAAIAEATNGIAADTHTKERETLTLLRDQEYAAYQDNEAQRLLEMYPNAPEVFSSPSWAEWKKEQTVNVLHMAESDNADDVSFVFEKYAKDMIAKHPELATPKEDKTETPVVTDKAQKIEAERQRKKETSVNISNPSAAGKTDMPDDPEALFKKYSEEIRKARTG